MTQPLTSWPVLSRYEDEHLQEISFPLGGIGAGSIALGGRAQLRDFELFNAPSKGFDPPNTFFALAPRPKDRPR